MNNNNKNIILLNCDDKSEAIEEKLIIHNELNDTKFILLLKFYLQNGLCYSGKINKIPSSRHIQIILNNNNNNIIKFSKRNSENEEIFVILPLQLVKDLSKYTPFISYKHYYYISILKSYFESNNYNIRLALTNKNFNLNNSISINLTNKNSKIKNNILQNNIKQNNKYINITSTNLHSENVLNALNIIKEMNESDKIRYMLLFVIYFFPLDILGKSFSNLIKNLYSHVANVKDYIKRILLHYIINIYPTNRLLANNNTEILLTYLYNETLFKIENKLKNNKNIYLINNNKNIKCELHKLYSIKNNCKINEYEIGELLLNINYYNIDINVYNLLNNIKSKKVNRKIFVKKKKYNNDSTVKIIENQIPYTFSYNLIKKIAENTLYISFHQLLLCNKIYEYNTFNKDLFDYLILTIIYVYGNRKFKNKLKKIKVETKLYNLPTKNFNTLNNNQLNIILNNVSKIFYYLNNNCNNNSLYINNMINDYNIFMNSNNNNNIKCEDNLNKLLYILNCNPNINLIKNNNKCAQIKECVLEKNNIMSRAVGIFKKVLPKKK